MAEMRVVLMGGRVDLQGLSRARSQAQEGTCRRPPVPPAPPAQIARHVLLASTPCRHARSWSAGYVLLALRATQGCTEGDAEEAKRGNVPLARVVHLLPTRPTAQSVLHAGRAGGRST